MSKSFFEFASNLSPYSP